MKVLEGFLCHVFIIGNGLALTRRQRRSGEVQDYGHPMKDNLLLLGSAVFLAAAMFGPIWWWDRQMHDAGALGRPIFLAIFLPLVAGIS
jgi:hypothetical protein